MKPSSNLFFDFPSHFHIFQDFLIPHVLSSDVQLLIFIEVQFSLRSIVQGDSLPLSTLSS